MRKIIDKALTNIDDKYIEEAQTYENKSSAKADLKSRSGPCFCPLLLKDSVCRRRDGFRNNARSLYNPRRALRRIP